MSKLSAITILRWGLAFTFFYAAIASLVNPQNWVGYFPAFLFDIFPERLLLVGFSLYEIVLATMLFIGKKLAWASLLAAISLAGITVFNLGVLDVVFRDVGLALAAFALHELVRGEKPLKEVLVEEIKEEDGI